jgi:hypothetical protein
MPVKLLRCLHKRTGIQTNALRTLCAGLLYQIT